MQRRCFFSVKVKFDTGTYQGLYHYHRNTDFLKSWQNNNNKKNIKGCKQKNDKMSWRIMTRNIEQNTATLIRACTSHADE